MTLDPNALIRAEVARRGVHSANELGEEDLVELALKYAIWMPASVYQRSPWLAPFAVRRIRRRVDPNAPGEIRDLWGFPDQLGRFTDDNSLIKGALRGRKAASPDTPYARHTLTTGFVCCHVWPTTTADPLLFSFVPNLVWLPSSLAEFSDAHFSNRSPHLLHHVLRDVSASRFLPHAPRVGIERSARAWDRLDPRLNKISGGVDLAEPDRIVSTALARTARMITFLEPLLTGEVPTRRFSRRYHSGAGSRIDSSVPPIQSFVGLDALRDLSEDMHASVQ
jgi:hypothetical protein